MKIRNILTAMAATLPLALLTPAEAEAEIRVEPMNWWIGMKNPEVQVMLHDTNIAKMEPSIRTKGIEISDVTRTDNPNYLFVTLKIGAKVKAGNAEIILKAEDGTETTIAYPLKERRANSQYRTGFSSDDAVFLVMPDRFANGDPTNDSVDGMLEKCDRTAPYGRHGGDLRGIINNLDYIAGLGMTALWMTPVLENDMEASSYHGYAITNYYQIDRREGTLEDMKELSSELHKRGMKHIMDMVFNHCGTNHWWMKDLPARDWINRWYDKDGNETFVRSSYRLSVIRDMHAPQSDRDLALKGWFDTTMADMNLTNPLVKTYMIQNSIWWIETADLDGIRQDTYPYSDVEAMAEWCDKVRAEYPYFNIVGECWISEAAKLATWQKGYGKDNGMDDSGLPTIMDFPLQEGLCRALTEKEGWSDGANRIYDVFANDRIYPNPMNMLIFGENHDVGRLLTQLKGDEKALRIATALLATARGIPQLYYGTETLMEGNGFDGHANIRKDFPGGWAGDTLNYFTNMPEREKAMHDYTARLFNFRKTSMALRRGSMTHFAPRENVYVFFRYDATTLARVMVVLNLADEDRTIDLTRFDEQIAGGKVKGTDVVTGEKVDMDGVMKIGGREAAVISIDN